MKKFKLALVSVGLFCSTQAFACPKVAGFTDRNCDGQFRIVFTGDSVVYGIGDSANKNKGGYVLRVAKKLKGVTVENFGVPGIASNELLANIKTGFSKSATKKQKLIATALSSADVVVIDVGRNDYFRNDRKRTPLQVLSTLRSMNTYIKQAVTKAGGTAPYLVQAVLMRPNRTDQGVFVKALDELILKSNSKNFPADLRFDLISKRLLNADQIHPTPRGYDAIAKTFLSYLPKKIEPNLLVSSAD